MHATSVSGFGKDTPPFQEPGSNGLKSVFQPGHRKGVAGEVPG